MKIYDQFRALTHDILYSGLFGSCALVQTNIRRQGALNLMAQDLREKYDAMIASETRPNNGKGDQSLSASRLECFVVVVEAVREIERFGVFKDIREPPYHLADTTESRQQRQNYLLLHTRVQAALRAVDEFSQVETRTPREQIRDHLQAAQQACDQILLAERSAPSNSDNEGEPYSSYTLRNGLFHLVAAAESMVEMENEPEGLRPK